jgi:SAM-dependent methyltransferase
MTKVQPVEYADGVLAAQSAEGLRLLAALCDPATERLLAGLGLPEKGRFAEIGAGSGSTARWLAEFRPGVQVLATDIDPTLMEDGGLPNLRIALHDVRTDPLPEAAFDLVHCRAVVSHLRDREEVIRRMSSWVAPGGQLVVEEPLICPLGESAHPVFRRLTAGIEEVLRETGGDVRWPRRVPTVLGGLGWTDLGMSALMYPCHRGGLGREAMRMTVLQTLPVMIGRGVLSAEEAEAGLACFDDEGFAEIGVGLISAWSRRPR